MPKLDDFSGEFDARTLADAAMIRKDPKRMQAAKKASIKLVKEQEARTQGLRAVARSKPRRSTSRSK